MIGLLRRLYRWTLDQAERPGAPWALGVVSFAESSFFPIPPDAMLIPMCLAKPSRAFWYATICTVTSVLGGLVGYAIGHLLYDTVGIKLIELYGYGAQADNFRAAYAEWGHWVILLKGLTPIPYKIVTITSGFAGYSLFFFILFSVITRGARFYLLAFLLNRYGSRARTIIEERLGFWVTIGAIGLALGFVVVFWVF